MRCCSVNRLRALPRVHIGQRIVKSALSVGLCFLIYVLRGRHGLPFYSALAALQCMQPLRESTQRMAAQRFSGTMTGAAFGLVILMLNQRVLLRLPLAYLWYCLAVSLAIVAALWTSAVALRRKNAAYFSCVVFLSITMNHVGDENPYLFVFNRVADTLIGIAVGMTVNRFHLPQRRRRDVLFVTALDDVLLGRTSTLTDYGRVELNRMLEEGIPLSVMTMRTLASFLEVMSEIHLRLPVILMDGAALYDPANNRFLEKRELEYDQAVELTGRLRRLGVDVCQNAIIGNSVLIFYQHEPEGMQRALYDRLRRSPYRNYIHRPLPEGERVVYLMALDRQEKIGAAYRALQDAGDTERYKVLCYPSDEYEGYAYLKIYRKDATKLGMLEALKAHTGYEKVHTFGSLPGQYDEFIPNATGDRVVRRLKREYEPPIWRSNFNL